MSDTPRTQALLDELAKFGYSTANDRVTGLCWELERENARLKVELAEYREDVKEYEATFQMRHKADVRAIKRWRAASPGRDLTLPDHADLVVWLLEQLEQVRANAVLTGAGNENK